VRIEAFLRLGGAVVAPPERTTTTATRQQQPASQPPLLIGTGRGATHFFLIPEMLPLLLISTVPAFTLLLVAPASKPGCKLARELGLLALLLATELLRHATAAGRRLRGRGREPERGARAMPAPPRPRPAALAAPGEEATPAAAGLPLLDLAELALDRVLEELSPASLAAMACVCAALRDRCSADALWERHLRAK